MKRIAQGTLTYTYYIDEDAKGTDAELVKLYTDQMVHDIIDNAYSDLAPCIEMVLSDRD